MTTKRAQYIDNSSMQSFPEPEADTVIKRNSNNNGWENVPLTSLVGQKQESFTATASQTSFILSETPSVDGYVMMFIQGVKQQYGADYTAADTVVTYISPDYTIQDGDPVEFWYITNVGSSGGGGGGSDNYSIVQDEGSALTGRTSINFIAGTNVTLDVLDDSGNDRTNVTINSTGGGGSGSLQDAFDTSGAASPSIDLTAAAGNFSVGLGSSNENLAVTTAGSVEINPASDGSFTATTTGNNGSITFTSSGPLNATAADNSSWGVFADSSLGKTFSLTANNIGTGDANLALAALNNINVTAISGTLDLAGGDSTSLAMNANDSSGRTLSVSSINSGDGYGNIEITADFIDIESTDGPFSISSTQNSNLGILANTSDNVTMSFSSINIGSGTAEMNISAEDDVTFQSVNGGMAINAVSNSNFTILGNSSDNIVWALGVDNAGSGNGIVNLAATNTGSGSAEINIISDDSILIDGYDSVKIDGYNLVEILSEGSTSIIGNTVITTCYDTSGISLNANSADDKQILIASQNNGAGKGNILLDSQDDLTLDAENTLSMLGGSIEILGDTGANVRIVTAGAGTVSIQSGPDGYASATSVEETVNLATSQKVSGVATASGGTLALTLPTLDDGLTQTYNVRVKTHTSTGNVRDFYRGTVIAHRDDSGAGITIHSDNAALDFSDPNYTALASISTNDIVITFTNNTATDTTNTVITVAIESEANA